jgi:hypothetical protein
MKFPNRPFSLEFCYLSPYVKIIPPESPILYSSLNIERPRFTLIQNRKKFEFRYLLFCEAKSQCNFLRYAGVVILFYITGGTGARGEERDEDEDKLVTWCKPPLLRFNVFVRKLLSCHKTTVFVPLQNRWPSVHTTLNSKSVTDGPIRSISAGSRNLSSHL